MQERVIVMLDTDYNGDMVSNYAGLHIKISDVDPALGEPHSLHGAFLDLNKGAGGVVFHTCIKGKVLIPVATQASFLYCDKDAK